MGVGPGDPELLTVAAVRVIQAATVVAYPVARPGAEGMAAQIAGPWIRATQRRLPLVLPMVEAAEPRRLAWHGAAAALAAAVAGGAVVALLCEGDASLYASGTYLLLALAARHPEVPLRVVPGITSLAAAAAAACAVAGPWPLALQQEPLLIRPTPDSAAALQQLLTAHGEGVLVLLKLGRRWPWVRQVLAERGVLEQALLAQRVGWPDQRLVAAAVVPAQEQPYFSLLLIRRGWPAVLP
ncbi:MAG: precorrin-2 C(20)-methyltransferase [Cyanobacteriota bacterium]|nr:precorrin-2 C(20)-methyltransferase [Cyanobacteriota bacterium]